MFPRSTATWSALFAIGLVAGGGCRAAWYDTDYRQDRDTVSAANDAGPRPLAKMAGPSAKNAVGDKLVTGATTATEHATPDVDEALLAGVMEKMQQVSELDPAATPELVAELQGMSPTFWPAAAEQFRSSLAYRKQQEAKHLAENAKSRNGTLSPENDNPGQRGNLRVVQAPEPTAPRGHDESPIRLASFDDHAAPSRDISAMSAQSVQPQVISSSPTIPNTRPPLPVPGPQPPATNSDWRSLTRSAADSLGQHVSASPASTGEVHEQVTLRMLRLLEGDTEQALAPIPGLSPVEQDYWSRQLFALATYLDHHAQPDDKRRAAASAIYLDEALDSLRDVGSLTLRNLTFCKQVLGYGAYEPYAGTRFSPGQSLTLYVEVENYHSESTDKGFVTLLGSSYELLNAEGQRVGGDSFPDVEDVCRSHRRDFHIQYGLRLPSTVQSGEYRLQLTVRDRQGDKIGTSSLEFEVAGVKLTEAAAN